MGDPAIHTCKSMERSVKSPRTNGAKDNKAEAEHAINKSDYNITSTIRHNLYKNTLFLLGDMVSWLPYALNKFII